jgi:hypothetical protein
MTNLIWNLPRDLQHVESYVNLFMGLNNIYHYALKYPSTQGNTFAIFNSPTNVKNIVGILYNTKLSDSAKVNIWKRIRHTFLDAYDPRKTQGYPDIKRQIDDIIANFGGKPLTELEKLQESMWERLKQVEIDHKQNLHNTQHSSNASYAYANYDDDNGSF